ncbi:MAG: transcriptional repressor [Bacteroidota bacterium]|nr:transcriptional repressor [Bacteroidota bacterium]
MVSSNELLHQHHLKSTPTRLDILGLFEKNPKSLTYVEISTLLGNGYDKVTIYRTLTTFEEAGIVHKIFNTNGSQSYALCHNDCKEHHHADNHVHFECEVCHNLVCLNDINVPIINLPKGFKANKINFLIEGICDKCNR